MTRLAAQKGSSKTAVIIAVAIGLFSTSAWAGDAVGFLTLSAAVSTNSEPATWTDGYGDGFCQSIRIQSNPLNSWLATLKLLRHLPVFGCSVCLLCVFMFAAWCGDGARRSWPLCDQARHERSGVLLI